MNTASSRLKICLLAIALLSIQARSSGRLSPKRSRSDLSASAPVNILLATFRINEVLLLFNLVPAFPW